MSRTSSAQPAYASETARKQGWSLLHDDRATLIVPLMVFSVVYACLFLLIKLFNQGHFVYTLDDPYIHLALAENIMRGQYGVNLTELSAPSSSILWPILLAPTAGLSWGYLVPLILNFLASAGVLCLFHTIVCAAFAPITHEQKNERIVVTLIFLMLATNLFGLAFTGMEHSLQLLLAMTVVVGLIQERAQQRVSWWLASALIIGPLVRYENLCLSVPALIYLLWRKHYGVTWVCSGILGLVVGGFSLFLYTSGLGLLPTSVFAKLNIASDSRLLLFFQNIYHNILDRQGVLLLCGIMLLLVQKNSRHRYLVVWAFVAATLHLVIGKFGWYGRYEIYIWATVLMILIYVYGETLWHLLFNASNGRIMTTIALLLVTFATPYVYTLFTTILASNNTYEQQYQMRRFAVDYYKAPVAVNDIGLVSYQNDAYVLDLGGLASRQALAMRQAKTNTWKDQLARANNVKFAMIYDVWTGGAPSNWILVGRLSFQKAKITPDDRTVAFYALDRATAEQVQPLLHDFQKTLPEDTTFENASDKAP